MTDEQLQEMRWSLREPPKASRIALFEDEFSRRANILLDESILTRSSGGFKHQGNRQLSSGDR